MKIMPYLVLTKTSYQCYKKYAVVFFTYTGTKTSPWDVNCPIENAEVLMYEGTCWD